MIEILTEASTDFFAALSGTTEFAKTLAMMRPLEQTPTEAFFSFTMSPVMWPLLFLLVLGVVALNVLKK